APPRCDQELLHAGFLHGGQLGQFLAALVGGHRQRLQLAAADIGSSGSQVVEREVHVAGKQGQLSGCTAVVRDVDHVDVGLTAEQFAGQVAAAAVTARTVVQDAGIGLGVVDQVLHGIDVQFL